MMLVSFDELDIGLSWYVCWWLLMMLCHISKTLLMISFLVYLIMWGYGASHENCTCRLGMGLLVRVLYFFILWTLIHGFLSWLYVKLFMLIWLMIKFVLCWIWSSLKLRGAYWLVYDLCCAWFSNDISCF